MSQEFKNVLLPILEELDEHDFDEAVIESPEITIAVRMHKNTLPEEAKQVTVFAPKAGNIEFAATVQNGSRVAADDQVATLRVLDDKIAVFASASGTIERLLPETGDFVQYGQALLEISCGD
jgi:biotin carboxyl carrier protein